MDRELKKQFKKLAKRENKILNKKPNKLFQSKVVPVKDKIQTRIPDKLKSVLESAFLKGFEVVFEKGHVYIEKTFNKENIRMEHDLNNYAINQKISKKHIKRLDRQAGQSTFFSSSLAFFEGGVLGLLGIGLPDIPIFISVIMKTIYEVALAYGYDYSKDEEKVYMLLIICGALTQGESQLQVDEAINKLGWQIDHQIQKDIDLKEQMKVTSEILSEAMLTAKFIQGIPLVGAVGALVNYSMMNKIGEYASIKYKKRYLLGKRV